MARGPSARELAYSGLFGAAALMLPVLFHLVRLGPVFMPMYLPLVALPFFVRLAPAAITGALVPLLSGAVTGMPPLYPPIAVCMAAELAFIAASIGWSTRRWPRINEWVVLVPALLLGRALNFGLVYTLALAMKLPAAFLAGLSLVSGWPGLILILIVVPSVARAGKAVSRREAADKQE